MPTSLTGPNSGFDPEPWAGSPPYDTAPVEAFHADARVKLAAMQQAIGAHAVRKGMQLRQQANDLVGQIQQHAETRLAELQAGRNDLREAIQNHAMNRLETLMSQAVLLKENIQTAGMVPRKPMPPIPPIGKSLIPAPPPAQPANLPPPQCPQAIQQLQTALEAVGFPAPAGPMGLYWNGQPCNPAAGCQVWSDNAEAPVGNGWMFYGGHSAQWVKSLLDLLANFGWNVDETACGGTPPPPGCGGPGQVECPPPVPPIPPITPPTPPLPNPPPTSCIPICGVTPGTGPTTPPQPCKPPEPTQPCDPNNPTGEPCIPPVPPAQGGIFQFDWCSMQVPPPAQFGQVPANAAGWIVDAALGLVGSVPWLGDFLRGISKDLQSAVQIGQGTLPCDIVTGSWFWGQRAILGFLEKWLGIGFTEPIETLSYWCHYLCPVEIPTAGETTEIFLANIIGGDLWRAWQRANNRCEEPAAALLQARRTRPNNDQLLSLWLREYLDDEQLAQGLRNNGVLNQPEADALVELANVIPGPGDLRRIAVARCFNPELVIGLGLDREMPPEFWETMSAQGLGYDSTTGAEQQAGFSEVSWAHRFWWSSWQHLSIGEALQCLYRLRPTGGPNGGPRDPSGIVFTDDDLLGLLQLNQVAPIWRDYILATSRKILSIRDLQQMAVLGIGNRAEFIESFKDLGYSDKAAQRKATIVRKRAASTRFKAEIQGAKSRVLDAYRIGALSRDDASIQVYGLTLSDAGEFDEFMGRPRGDQLAIVSAHRGIAVELDSVELDEDIKLVKAAIGATKTLFLRGRLSKENAFNRLRTLGVQPLASQRYVDRWEQALGPQLREQTAQQILTHYRHQILTATQAYEYIHNLGWPDYDVAMMLAETNRDIALDVAKAQAQAAKDAKQRQRALEQAVKAARAEHNRLRAELARHGSPGELEQWVVEGTLTPAEMATRLAELDWPADDAARKVDSAVLKVEKAIATAEQKAEKAQQAAEAKAEKAAQAAERLQRQREAKPSLADLKRWYVEGIYTLVDVRKDLDAKEWLPEDIDTLFEEWALLGIGPPALAP